MLREKDNKTWEFFNSGNCSIKSSVPFNGIGADYRIEQENRTLKVVGGVTGILINKIKWLFIDLDYLPQN